MLEKFVRSVSGNFLVILNEVQFTRYTEGEEKVAAPLGVGLLKSHEYHCYSSTCFTKFSRWLLFKKTCVKCRNFSRAAPACAVGVYETSNIR